MQKKIKRAPALVRVIWLQSVTNLCCTFKLAHPQGEMTPIHLIPRIISRLHSCWFGASVRAAGIGVRLGSAAAFFQLRLLFSHAFPQRPGNGSGTCKILGQFKKNPVTTVHLPDVGRKEAIAASCMTMTQQGDWHFWQNPNNIFETAHLRVKNAFLRGIPQAPVNMLWYRKCIHRAVSELKWNSKCVSYGSMLGSFDMITTFYISFPILPQTVTSYFRWHEVTRFLKENQEQFQFCSQYIFKNIQYYPHNYKGGQFRSHVCCGL